MSGRTDRRAAAGLGTAVAVWAAYAGLAVLYGGSDVYEMGLFVAGAAFSATGFVVLARVPGNRMGWLLTFAGIGLPLSGAQNLIPGILESGGSEALASVLMSISGPPFWALLVTVLVLIPLWFPTGTALGPLWRWPGRIGIATWAGIAFLDLFGEDVCISSDPDTGSCLRMVSNAIGIRGVPRSESSPLGGVLFVAAFLCGVAALVSMGVRYRRAAAPQRAQLKWLLYSVAALVAWIVVASRFEDSLEASPVGTRLSEIAFSLLVAFVPVSIGVAITRYRLYDIDRIINRTLVYAVVVAILATLFVGSVALTSSALPTGNTNLGVAASTLAVAGLFNPLRRRVQRTVNRRFFRLRYDAEDVLGALTTRLRNQVNPDDVGTEWVTAVSATLQPRAAGVWLREGTR